MCSSPLAWLSEVGRLFRGLVDLMQVWVKKALSGYKQLAHGEVWDPEGLSRGVVIIGGRAKGQSGEGGNTLVSMKSPPSKSDLIKILTS